MLLPRIDKKSPHAADAQKALDRLTKAGVDPALISKIIHMILAGLPGILELIDALLNHNPTPAPNPPAPPAA